MFSKTRFYLLTSQLLLISGAREERMRKDAGLRAPVRRDPGRERMPAMSTRVPGQGRAETGCRRHVHDLLYRGTGCCTGHTGTACVKKAHLSSIVV